MDIHALFDEINAFLKGDGTPCEFGCSEAAVPEVISAAKERYPEKPYCVIAEWTWIDVSVSEQDKEKFEQLGARACFVYSPCILEDEAKRRHIVSSVRTTALVEFHSNCVFVTLNTSYILCGLGSRVSLSPLALTVLAKCNGG